ncbi:MAG TPA: NTP transferase domain-containing protein [Gaiellaceae bacterium]
MSQPSITGILLLGGASVRFGSPKAIARLEGRTLAERAWEALAWCDERLALGKGDSLGLPFPVEEDGFEVRAPIAGVVGGLRRAAHDVCVFLPVDCPLVGEHELRVLAAACRDAAVPQTGPLPGRSGAPRWPCSSGGSWRESLRSATPCRSSTVRSSSSTRRRS